MIKVALRGLAGRKLRAALTGIAIVLGVAMISGTYVLTDTIDRAFSNLFSETYAGTDAVVSGKGADISFQGDTTDNPPVDAALLDEIRAVPEVDVAAGSIVNETDAKILTPEGEAINTEGAPSFGFGLDTSPALTRFNPLNLLEGRWADGPGEVVIDAGTADRQNYEVGERVGVATLEPAREFELVGIAQYGGVDTIGTATFAVFEIPTAQKLLERQGQYDAISVAGKEGVEPDELIEEIQPILPADARVRTAQVEADEEHDEISEFTSFLRYFLLAFAVIALFVGSFVIFNTLSITVAQRTRELATLRTLGASRRQVLGSVILEAFVIGLLASALGLVLGVLLAEGIEALFRSFGFALPTAERVFAARTVVVSLIAGIGVTLLAALFPAIRATRVPPISAVREGATLPRSRLAPLAPWLALLTIGLALFMLGRAMFVDDLGTADRLLSIGVGVLLLFVGVAMISSRLVRPIAAVVGIPARRLGGAAGRLATGNAIRNPGRTAATAAALMIGIALVAFVATLADGMKASNREAIEEQVIADYVVTSQDGFTPFVAGAGDALASSNVPEVVTSVRSDLGEIDGDAGYVTGIDPLQIEKVYRFDWKEGSGEVLDTLGTRGAILDTDYAEEHDLGLGSRVTLRSASNLTAGVEVVGLYEPPPFYPLLGSLSVSTRLFDSLYDRPRNQFTFASVRGDPSLETTEALGKTVAGYPDAKLQTREEWIADQDAEFDEFLSFLYVLLALSVIVSLFGMVNTLVLSVYERTREIGMLRAIGMTRRQIRRMVRQESVITALIGAALGLPLGIFLAALVTRALSEFDVRFSIPWPQLIVLSVVAIVAGILAAITPARRAAKLDPLQAIAYE